MEGHAPRFSGGFCSHGMVGISCCLSLTQIWASIFLCSAWPFLLYLGYVRYEGKCYRELRYKKTKSSEGNEWGYKWVEDFSLKGWLPLSNSANELSITVRIPNPFISFKWREYINNSLFGLLLHIVSRVSMPFSSSFQLLFNASAGALNVAGGTGGSYGEYNQTVWKRRWWALSILFPSKLINWAFKVIQPVSWWGMLVYAAMAWLTLFFAWS